MLPYALATVNAIKDVLIWSRATMACWEAGDIIMTTGDFLSYSEQK